MNCSEELIISKCLLQHKYMDSTRTPWLVGVPFYLPPGNQWSYWFHSEYIFTDIIASHVWQQLQTVRTVYLCKIYSQLTSHVSDITLPIFLKGSIASALWLLCAASPPPPAPSWWFNRLGPSVLPSLLSGVRILGAEITMLQVCVLQCICTNHQLLR